MYVAARAYPFHFLQSQSQSLFSSCVPIRPSPIRPAHNDMNDAAAAAAAAVPRQFSYLGQKVIRIKSLARILFGLQ